MPAHYQQFAKQVGGRSLPCLNHDDNNMYFGFAKVLAGPRARAAGMLLPHVSKHFLGLNCGHPVPSS